MFNLIYPSVEDVIETNKRALELKRITKAEKHELKKPRSTIRVVLDKVKIRSGDVYFKAALLMKGLNKLHPFDAANKMTAFLVANNFLFDNAGFAVLKKENDKKNLDMMLKIRAGTVTEKDISRWLKN